MLTLFAAALIFLVGWCIAELVGYLPNILCALVLILSNIQYGLVSYNVKYDQWGDRLLWGLSFIFLIYSYIYNWNIYLLIMSDHDEMKTLFGVLVIIVTPVLASIGPFRLVFDHFTDPDDDLFDEYDDDEL